ncbi:MAG: acyltransferase [Paucibacter sp.]|nr:acyltransferase [Roseateles sp.]
MGTARLQQIDALRGIAALAVVLYHYSYTFPKFYNKGASVLFTASWGFLGVQLFFLISGFVIFMTLERTRRASDFLVSRFSRLYPTYWTCMLLTTVFVAWLDLPRLQLGWRETLLNLLMFQGLLHVRNTDGAYWTLAVELLFYAWALAAFSLGRLGQLRGWLLLALLLRLLQHFEPLTLPTRLSTVMILPFAPWFACGIAVYGVVREGPRVRHLGLLAAATTAIAICDDARLGLVAPALSLALYLAGTGRLPWLSRRPLLWLGRISYPLYLVHQYIGYALLLQLDAAGVPIDSAILLVLALMLATASLLHSLIEQPAMDWIRARWRHRS